jgi:hypothetical protein
MVMIFFLAIAVQILWAAVKGGILLLLADLALNLLPSVIIAQLRAV